MHQTWQQVRVWQLGDAIRLSSIEVRIAIRGRMCPAGDLRDVSTQWQADAKLGGRTILAIMLQKALAHVTGCDPNDRIFTRIVGWGTAKKLYPDDALFQGFEVTGDGLIDDVL